MVAAPNRSHVDYDKLAREYILSLKAGNPVDEIREDFGKWEIEVGEIENYSRQCNGNPKEIAAFIDRYCKGSLGNLLINHDEQAREYILKLKSCKVEIEHLRDWPETGYGDWELIIAELERYYARCRADTKLMADKIDLMCNTYPELEDLLQDDTMQGGNEEHSDESIPQESIPPIKYELPSMDLSNRPLMRAMDPYIGFSKELSPESYEWFHVAGFFSLLSIIAMRRIEIDFRDPIYTNLYIALCAKSTVWKKSYSARAIERIVNGIGIAHMLHKGEETPEFFVEQAKGGIPKNYTDLTREQQDNELRAIATAGLEALFFDELGHYLVATRRSPEKALWKRIILEWNSCMENWRKGTKGGGWEIVEKTYLSIFGSMTPDNLGEGGMEAVMKDGTIQRFITIAPQAGTRAKTKSFERGYLPTPPSLIKMFRDWHERLGIPRVDIVENVEPDDKGREKITLVKTWIDILKSQRISMTDEAYDYWHAYREAISECIAENNIPSYIAAYYERLATDYVKIAALAASFEGCHEIDIAHLAMVYPFIEEGRKGIHRAVNQSGREISEGSSYREKQSSLENEVLFEIKEYTKKKDSFTIAQILNRRTKLKRIPISEINIVIENFWKAGVLNKEIVTNERTKAKSTFYKLA